MSINRNRQDENGNTIFHLFVVEDRFEALREVIRQYFIKFPHGKQSLATLIGKKNYADKGGGRTALHYAHSAKCVHLLVRYGANVDEQDAFGLTPLHIFILENRVECMKAVIALGASVNISCKKSFNFPGATTASKRGVKKKKEKIENAKVFLS